MLASTGYGTFAPPASICAECRKEIRVGRWARRDDIERQSGAPAAVYRHAKCAGLPVPKGFA